MKNPLILLLLCAVLSLATPVSADYYWCKDVNADDFTNALVDYCNGNTIHNMTKYEFKLSNHGFKARDVVRTDKLLEFRFMCKDSFCIIIPFIIPFPVPQEYEFYGTMHVDNPRGGLKKPYTLTITNDDTKFTAVGKNWRLEAWDVWDTTRFKR